MTHIQLTNAINYAISQYKLRPSLREALEHSRLDMIANFHTYNNKFSSRWYKDREKEWFDYVVARESFFFLKADLLH